MSPRRSVLALVLDTVKARTAALASLTAPYHGFERSFKLVYTRDVEQTLPVQSAAITFETSPDQYKHWKLTIDGPVATLGMDVREDAGLRPNDYKLKLNSYDLGVDIELADALQRIRFEHPQVHAVIVSSLKPRIFCAGANIFMLGSSSHGFKVNFCKYTNETRLDRKSVV